MGEPLALIGCIDRLREIVSNQIAWVTVGDWTLVSTWDVRMHAFRLDSVSKESRTVVYDPKAWAVAGGVLIDVPVGGYTSPLDFGDVEFCERSQQDIGVTVLGTVRYDLRRPETPPVDVPDSWPATKAHLASQGLAATIRQA
jgi:hypothetical protein